MTTKLWQRGLECRGCTEKHDFVDLLVENLGIPIVQGRASSESDTAAKVKDESVDELLKNLEKSGLGGTKVFSAKDFEGLSPEEISAKFGGGGGGFPGKGKKSRKAKTPKTNMPKMEIHEDKEERIEL